VKNELLVVDDEPDVRLGFSLYLKKAGFAVHEAGSLSEARHALLTRSVDAVLLDLNLPDGNGLDWIAEVREERPGAAIVVVTGKGDIPLAVEAMRRGADHFLTKPVNMNELEVFLRRGLEVAGMRRTALAQRRLSGGVDASFGDGIEVKAALDLASLASENDSPVLLLGETGCGKGVLARWIHERSKRAAAPCSATPAAPSPRRSATGRGCWTWPTGGRCSWTRSGSSTWTCRRSSSRFSRRSATAGSVTPGSAGASSG